MSVGKLMLNNTLDEIIDKVEDSTSILPISLEAIRQVKELSFHHRDPFDRLLIAKAQVENLMVITNDKAFEQYTVSLLW